MTLHELRCYRLELEAALAAVRAEIDRRAVAARDGSREAGRGRVVPLARESAQEAARGRGGAGI